MKSTPKRLGNGEEELVSAKAGSDSSQGSAMVTPAPYNSLRRVRPCDFSVRLDMGLTDLRRTTFVAELTAVDNGFDHWGEAVFMRRKRGPHLLHRWIVGEQQRATERVRQQLAAEIVDEVVLAIIANVGLDAFQAIAFALAAREDG